jgi:PilZ domain-containing protein
MPEAAMPEARRSERLKSLLRARIVFNAGSSTIECVIKNVSAHGMRLEIADGLSVPGEFDLEVPHKGRTYRTRRDGMVGVGLRAAERRAFALTTSFSGWNGRIRSCGCSYAN